MAVIKYIILKIYILLTVSILWIENNLYIFSRNMSIDIIENINKNYFRYLDIIDKNIILLFKKYIIDIIDRNIDRIFLEVSLY